MGPVFVQSFNFLHKKDSGSTSIVILRQLRGCVNRESPQSFPPKSKIPLRIVYVEKPNKEKILLNKRGKRTMKMIKSIQRFCSFDYLESWHLDDFNRKTN